MSTTTKLADWLFAFADGRKADSIMLCKAAAELRRLSAENAELRAEKRVTLSAIDSAADLLSRFVGRQTITSDEFGRVLDRLRAIQANNLDSARAAMKGTPE